LPLNQRSAAGFGTDRLRCEEAMKTARRENPNRWVATPRKPSTRCGRSEQTLLNQVGCEARKTPAVGVVFFLDFSLLENLPGTELTPTKAGTFDGVTATVLQSRKSLERLAAAVLSNSTRDGTLLDSLAYEHTCTLGLFKAA